MSSDKYYKLLNLEKSNNPSEKDIKKAYKKAAMKWHPDKWASKSDSQKKNAEKKFKDVSEAYEVLSNPDKKKNYDLYGEPGIRNNMNFNNNPFNMHGMNSFNQGRTHFVFTSNGNSFSDPNDLFNSFFGGGRQFPQNFHPQHQNKRNKRHSPKKTKEVNIYCTLEELYNGTVKKMRISNDYTDSSTGLVKPKTKVISLNIKKGWKEGTKITYNLDDYIVKFTIMQKPHSFYKRTNNDIIWVCKLTKEQSEKGVNITIPLINGETINMTTKGQMIYNGKRQIINNKGMPIKNTSNYGDFIIEYKII